MRSKWKSPLWYSTVAVCLLLCASLRSQAENSAPAKPAAPLTPLSQFLSAVSTNRATTPANRDVPAAGLQGFITGSVAPETKYPEPGRVYSRVTERASTNSAERAAVRAALEATDKPASKGTNATEQFLTLSPGSSFDLGEAPALMPDFGSEASAIFSDVNSVASPTIESVATSPRPPAGGNTAPASTSAQTQPTRLFSMASGPAPAPVSAQADPTGGSFGKIVKIVLLLGVAGLAWWWVSQGKRPS